MSAELLRLPPAARRVPPAAAMPVPDRGPALWHAIRRLALEAAAREPMLRPLLRRTVLGHAAPGAIVAAVLSRAVTPELQGVVAETLDDDGQALVEVEADLAAVATRDPACRSVLHALLLAKGFHALQLHRVAHRLWRRGRHELAQWLAAETSVRLAVDIHPAVPIGRGVLLDHATGIVVGETALIEDEVTLLHGVTLGATGKQRGDRHPKVRRGALLGAGATVLGSIEVGALARVAASSVVLDAVPAGSTVAGVPARVVRTDGAAGADAA
jgi:serine O-acetyltransferase